MVTQRTIARHLKVSTATVSRALSNAPGTDHATRARVLNAAAQFGYRASRKENGAQQASGNKLLSILVYEGPESLAEGGIFLRVLRGATEEARNQDASLHIDYVKPELAGKIEQPQYQPPALRDGHSKGLLLVGLFPDAVVNKLADRWPCVQMHLRSFNPKVDFIGQDDHEACDRLVQHLHQLGHRRIGFFALPEDLSWTYGRARLAGFIEALVHYGYPLRPEDWVAEGIDNDPDAMASAFDTVERRCREGVTAWICVHDNLGYRLSEALPQRGLTVPRHVSICAFDDVSAPAHLPKLSSIAWPMEDMGVAGVRVLCRRISNPTLAPERVVSGGRFAPGESTAVPFKTP